MNTTDSELAGTTIQVYFDVKLVLGGEDSDPQVQNVGPLDIKFEEEETPYYFIDPDESS